MDQSERSLVIVFLPALHGFYDDCWRERERGRETVRGNVGDGGDGGVEVVMVVVGGGFRQSVSHTPAPYMHPIHSYLVPVTHRLQNGIDY